MDVMKEKIAFERQMMRCLSYVLKYVIKISLFLSLSSSVFPLNVECTNYANSFFLNLFLLLVSTSTTVSFHDSHQHGMRMYINCRSSLSFIVCISHPI